VVITSARREPGLYPRVIGLPGDTVEVRDGRLVLNGRPVRAEQRPPVMIPVDANSPCGEQQFWGRQVQTEQGAFCRLPIVHETLPNGVSYDTIDDGRSQGDDFGPVRIPADHLFLMGDNRDHSADSRFSLAEQGLGGPVPWENIGGRAEFITFSLDGTTIQPATWFPSVTAGRGSLRRKGITDEAAHPLVEARPSDLSRSVRDEARKAAVWLGMALAIVGVSYFSIDPADLGGMSLQCP
jgi:signal peptidase I